MTTGSGASVIRMRLRYDGACAGCGVALAAGVQAIWDRDAKVVRCLGCHSAPTAAPERVELGYVEGEAGASAAREFERRHQARHDRVTSAHPRLGKVLLAVFDDPQSTKAWAQGASGEQSVGESLRQVAGEDVRVLNDRRIPRSRANMDHIAISRLGVFVIDAKRYRNQRPTLRVEGGLFSPRRELLLVGGRNRSPLVDGVHKQASWSATHWHHTQTSKSAGCCASWTPTGPSWAAPFRCKTLTSSIRESCAKP